MLEVNPVGEPDAGNPHVRFDERAGETGRHRHGTPTDQRYCINSICLTLEPEQS